MANLLTSTDVAKRAGLSAVKLNAILYSKGILNKRGRPSKKDPKVFKPFWEILEFKFGKNIPSHHGGGVVKFYPHMVDELLVEAGLGGLR